MVTVHSEVTSIIISIEFLRIKILNMFMYSSKPVTNPLTRYVSTGFSMVVNLDPGTMI